MLLQGSSGGSRASGGSTENPTVELDCQVPGLSGSQERISVLVPFGLPCSPRPLPLGAEVGNGLSYFSQGLQQCPHCAQSPCNLLIGQVSVKRNSSQLVEDPSDCIMQLSQVMSTKN